MANKFFDNFPEIQYTLADGKIVYIKDFFRKSKIEQDSIASLTEYELYSLTDGERPDTLASKLYGDSDLHWTFFIVNELENYYDWHKDVLTFERYIDKKYPGQYAIGSASTDIVNRPINSSDQTHKFLLGEKVTSASAMGRILLVEPSMNRIAIETVDGSFVSNETITGKVSTKSFTPTSVINHRDGAKYYENAIGLRRNTPAAGYTVKTIYNTEFETNESKRHIKIISPGIIDNIVRRFEKVMTS
jgi:hypothetical protein